MMQLSILLLLVVFSTFCHRNMVENTHFYSEMASPCTSEEKKGCRLVAESSFLKIVKVENVF